MVSPERKNEIVSGLIGLKAFSSALFVEIQDADLENEIVLETKAEDIETWFLGLIELNQVCELADDELDETGLIGSLFSKEERREISDSSVRVLTLLALQTRETFFPGIKDEELMMAYFNSAQNYQLSQKVPSEKVIKLELKLKEAKILTENMLYQLLSLTFSLKHSSPGPDQSRYILASEFSLEGLTDIASQLRSQGVAVDSQMLGNFQETVNKLDTMRQAKS